MPIENTDGYMIPAVSSTVLADPFGQLSIDLTNSELRETAYEIFVGACRSSGGSRPLTYVSQSSGRSSDRSVSSLPSLQRSLTSTAASKVKKALGMKSKKKNSDKPVTENRPATVGELMRVQMRISEQVDSRVRRSLLRIAAGQLGRRIESIVLPVEFLHQFKSSDFPTQREFEVWQRRHLKVLEAGLLLHPKLPLDRKDTSAQQLRQIIRGAHEKPMETGKHSDAVQTLRAVTTQLACRSIDDYAPDTCHWADGAPLNLRLYQVLLEALFDVEEPTSMIEEVDEVLELIKKTWGILGIDLKLHNLCFSWVLFNHYVSTGQVEDDFLFASDNLLLEVKKDAKSTLDSGYSKILCSTLSSMLEWAERGLLAYHESFYRGNIDIMQSILSLGLSAATILAEENPRENGKMKVTDVANAKVDIYIRSSMRKAFSQESEKVRVSRKSTKSQLNHLPALCMLAQDITDLAFTEKEIYSPILQRWHPLAVGVAVATLHSCFGQEVHKFVSGIKELTPDILQVLIAADKLEKDLVQMAVEDSVNSDDGGKSIIQEMTPYEAEAVIVDLVKSWIKIRVDRLDEWVDRNLQQEVWNPKANRERFAPSAVEVLRTIDETLEAFFLLPIPVHPDLLPGLMTGLDKCLQDYILKAKSGSGSRSSFLPVLPPLTRCDGGSKLGIFKKKDRSQILQRRKSQLNTIDDNDIYDIPQLCVRVNTFNYIRKELEVLEKRTIAHLNSEIPIPEYVIVDTYERDYSPTFNQPPSYLRARGVRAEIGEFVEYDLDNEDEDWLEEFNRERNILSDEKFETIVFKLEVLDHKARERAGVITPTLGAPIPVLLTFDAAVEALQALNIKYGVFQAIYNYWKEKRERWQKPVLRRLQPPPPVNDTNPYNVFRPREKAHRLNTRRMQRRENNVQSFEKLRQVRRNLEQAKNLLEAIIKREEKKRDVIDSEVILQRIHMKYKNEADLLEDSLALPGLPSFLSKLASSEDEFVESDDIPNHNRLGHHPYAVHNHALMDSRFVMPSAGAMKREFRRPSVPYSWLHKMDPLEPILPFTKPLDPVKLAAAGIVPPQATSVPNSTSSRSYNPRGRIGRGGRIIFDRWNPLMHTPIDCGDSYASSKP